MLEEVKLALRITGDDFDNELIPLIEACKSDLALAGVASASIIDTDYLIKRAVINYCKAEFGYDNPDSEKFKASYESLKTHLAISYRIDEVL
jgi:uncharacterized phage protein (predicted DNA packaging)